MLVLWTAPSTSRRATSSRCKVSSHPLRHLECGPNCRQAVPARQGRSRAAACCHELLAGDCCGGRAFSRAASCASRARFCNPQPLLDYACVHAHERRKTRAGGCAASPGLCQHAWLERFKLCCLIAALCPLPGAGFPTIKFFGENKGHPEVRPAGWWCASDCKSRCLSTCAGRIQILEATRTTQRVARFLAPAEGVCRGVAVAGASSGTACKPARAACLKPPARRCSARAPQEYNGGRDSGSLATFANERWSAQQPPPEVRAWPPPANFLLQSSSKVTAQRHPAFGIMAQQFPSDHGHKSGPVDGCLAVSAELAECRLGACLPILPLPTSSCTPAPTPTPPRVPPAHHEPLPGAGACG